MSHYPPPCLAWAEKLALRPNDLSSADREALDAHMATCAACKAAQEDYQFLDDGLRSLPPPAMKPLPRLPFFVQFDEDEATPVQQELAEGREDRRRKETRNAPARRPASPHSRRRFSMIGHFAAPVVAASLILATLLLFNMLRGNLHDPSQVGDLLNTYTEPSGSIYGVAWSPDGKLIATASGDSFARVWDYKSGKTITTHKTHKNSVTAIAWSPNGKLIASGSYDGTIQIWSATTGLSVQTIVEPPNEYNYSNRIRSLSWSPDGRYIVSGSDDQVAYVWDTTRVDKGPITSFSKHDAIIETVAWSPKGNYIASGGDDGMIYVWDPYKSNHAFFTFPASISGSATVVSLSWSPDGKSLVSFDRNDAIQIWDMTGNARNPVYSRQGNIVNPSEVKTIAWSRDGRRIAYNDAQNTINILDFHQDRVLYTYSKHTNLVNTLSWSPDGKYIASGDLDGRVQVWYAGI